MSTARLICTRSPRRPRAAVIVLHGGGGRRGSMMVRPTQLSVLGMIPIAWRLALRGRGRLAVFRLLNSTRGWNVERTPVDDAAWAIEEIREQLGPSIPIGLVGHSLGGMEAAALAGRETGYAITDVVTAGAPTAQVGELADGVRVLSLEHEGDVVPLLDGAANPDTVEQVTVRFAHGGDGTVVGEHGYEHYRAGAAAVDASTDPAVAERVAALRDQGFLGSSAEVTSRVFQVVRDR